MKLLLVIPLFLLGVCERADPAYTNLYSGLGGSGYVVTLRKSVKSLAPLDIDDDIESVEQTGFWIYYEHENYNERPGDFFFVVGTNIAVDIPVHYRNMASSVRYAGPLLNNDTDIITLYDGKKFSGKDFSMSNDVASIGDLTGKVSSLIITGTTPWTVYSGVSFTGQKRCVFPSVLGETIDFGFYPDMTTVGLSDGAIKSVKKFCHAEGAGMSSTQEDDGRH